MKAISLTAPFCLLLSTFAVAQDTKKKANATVAKDWIKEFEGAWTTTSRSPPVLGTSGPGGEPDGIHTFPDLRARRSGVGATSDMVRRWL